MSDSDWTIDDEHWSDGEDDDVENAAAVPCPECGAELFDDADHCHRCGHWLTEADRRALDRNYFPSRGVRIIAIGLLVMFLVSLLLFGSIF